MIEIGLILELKQLNLMKKIIEVFGILQKHFEID